MLSLVILFLIISTLFLIEFKSIVLLAYYIMLVLILAIVISIFPEYNTYGEHNQICDISYISYILILVQISALTIIFGFIIMLYPNNNTEIYIIKKGSITNRGWKVTKINNRRKYLILISIILILGICYFIFYNIENIYQIYKIYELSKQNVNEFTKISNYPKSLTYLHMLLCSIYHRTFFFIFKFDDFFNLLNTQEILDRFSINYFDWYNWLIPIYIPFLFENTNLFIYSLYCLILNHFLVESPVIFDPFIKLSL